MLAGGHRPRETVAELVTAGCAAIEGEEAERGRAVEETAGVLTRVYEPCELERQRKDWGSDLLDTLS